MPISKHGDCLNPKKSPYNYEKYDSSLELMMMEKLDSDPSVKKWMKRHGITIPWVDVQKHMRRYVPDFLVEYIDDKKAIIEVKSQNMIDTDEVKRKRKAAEIWCKRRGMEFIVAVI